MASKGRSRSPITEAVLATLKTMDQPSTSVEIASVCKMEVNIVSTCLARLHKGGHVYKMKVNQGNQRKGLADMKRNNYLIFWCLHEMELP